MNTNPPVRLGEVMRKDAAIAALVRQIDEADDRIRT
jgi:hypothetical protein